jgi:hypothetical protein
MENIKEYWKSIEEYPEYEVSSIGRIRNKKGRILKFYDSFGYSKIKLVHPITKKRKQNAIHRLVALAFIPQCLWKTEVNHKNKVKNDNKSNNLEWTDRSGNMQHIFKDMISINFVLEIYNKNKNISTSKFKQLLLKKPL